MTYDTRNKTYRFRVAVDIVVDAKDTDDAEALLHDWFDAVAPIMEDRIQWPEIDWTIDQLDPSDEE